MPATFTVAPFTAAATSVLPGIEVAAIRLRSTGQVAGLALNMANHLAMFMRRMLSALAGA
ncbi:hypothetical protein HTZ77_30020 [Nonomuraea sp. SMC257]|uniref:Uncharacterized protein n=1 Tax=Nonomuraea montanisoli TaxID=2741721 RepID=A0A7Y6IDR0_9ACTN|nr:hypothetical protein [Nonomuraea montanisoli]NUW35635.1 hypothetical protein [Nonomuraea montanisoli]